MNKSIAVIGLGRYGKSIATELYKNGADVLVIDGNPEIVNEIADSVTCAMSLDVCDMDALREAGISNMDAGPTGQNNRQDVRFQHHVRDVCKGTWRAKGNCKGKG